MSGTRLNSVVINSVTRTILTVLACSIIYLLSNVTIAQGKGERRFTPKVTLIKPRGFAVSIDDARDVRQFHIFWNLRKTYNRTRPYSTTDFTNVTFNPERAPVIGVGDSEVELRPGDTVFYWLMVTTADWTRHALHKLNFWIKPVSDAARLVEPVPVSETYYRDYTNYCTNDKTSIPAARSVLDGSVPPK